MFAARDGLNGEERVREGEAAWLVGGDETRLISVMVAVAAAELFMCEVTAEEAAKGGHVPASGVADVLESNVEVCATLCVQGADMDGKLWSRAAPAIGMSEEMHSKSPM